MTSQIGYLKLLITRSNLSGPLDFEIKGGHLYYQKDCFPSIFKYDKWSCCFQIPLKKWATSWQNQQSSMCAQRRLRSVWASTQSEQSSLTAWRKLGSLATHWAHSEDWSDWQMPRLIRVFVGCTVILFVLSRGGSLMNRSMGQLLLISHNSKSAVS